MQALKPGTLVVLNYSVQGAHIDGVYTVNSASNVGTRRKPVYRYYLGGVGFVDADAITPKEGSSK